MWVKIQTTSFVKKLLFSEDTPEEVIAAQLANYLANWKKEFTSISRHMFHIHNFVTVTSVI